MARFLVTGGAGFIGSHLTDALLAGRHDVAVLDDLSTGKRANLDPRATLYEGSILDDAAVAGAMRGAAACFHLAAIASVQRCESDVVQAYRVNHEGGLRVFAAAAAAGIPVVYASSAAVYGDAAGTPAPEAEAGKPLGFYGAAKFDMEGSARRLGARRGLRSFGLRYFNVYGPRQDPTSPYSGVISIFVDRARRGEALTVFGDGTQTRDFVAVGDIATATITALGHASRDAPVVNVGTGQATTVLALARLACAAAGVGEPDRQIRFAPARAGDIQHSIADTRRLRATLGMVPATPLADGLRALFAWTCGSAEPAQRA